MRLATLVDWYAAPEWVTVDQSAFLLGVTPDTKESLIDAGGVELVCGSADLINKGDLREFWDTYWDLANARKYIHLSFLATPHRAYPRTPDSGGTASVPTTRCCQQQGPLSPAIINT